MSGKPLFVSFRLNRSRWEAAAYIIIYLGEGWGWGKCFDSVIFHLNASLIQHNTYNYL